MTRSIQIGAVVGILISALVPSPGVAVSDGPFDDACSGVKRFGSPGHISVYPPNQVQPHQGLVLHPDTTTVALFVLEDVQREASAETDDGESDIVWYLMSGTTGFAGRCEPIVCPWFEAHMNLLSLQPNNVSALMTLADELSANGC